MIEKILFDETMDQINLEDKEKGERIQSEMIAIEEQGGTAMVDLLGWLDHVQAVQTKKLQRRIYEALQGTKGSND